MTQDPIEKAKELVGKFRAYSAPAIRTDSTFWSAKQCALIAVQEIINSCPALPSPNPVNSLDECVDQAKEFWQQVKNEINNL